MFPKPVVHVYMSFTSSKKKGSSSGLRLLIGQDAIDQVENANFLGVYLDEKLTWSTHIKIIANKIAKNIGIIKRISHVISPKLRLNLYHTMVSPYMTYGNIVWASNYESRIHCFTTLHKRVLRIIVGDNPRATILLVGSRKLKLRDSII